MAKNMLSNALRLILKQKWFRMIESGIKLEDYREIKPFYISRLKKKPTIVQFQLGYKKTVSEWYLKFGVFPSIIQAQYLQSPESNRLWTSSLGLFLAIRAKSYGDLTS
ncbi:MAG: hypothetical protein FWC26_00500 [Fibromonadales bacterium]|nr:hypothetical protein [Fibromonadales bacterium]